ncbi:RNA polymerase II subunit 5-mediating protein homolog isoform X3 [Rosa chinensis]|uniref:RNA polymerase II subunit 5-mediating protein homolog isoform X3 n=1 Tax=Rosa chinensis TaxID=74649 RepID=UPI000D095324|nr:RNA polymerase II subunit 5-mediating protein homolog isoform X3 [Rosa chinensis]
MRGKGTVTPLSSVFSVEDTQKAAKRVQDTIAQKDLELDHLRGFAADNTDLINLVARLPEHLHHDIMVPFGKAAFFPGRLVHTNEFMVLLGEGYYAERTSKQTVDILNRRGKVLESQVDSLKAMVQDLKAEASFFNATATEAAEGLVEIVEDYEEESSSDRECTPKQDYANNSRAVIAQPADEDEEFARMMARMDELEKEEREAESHMAQSDEDEQLQHGLHQLSDQKSLHGNLKISEQYQSRKPPEQTKDGIASNEDSFTDVPSGSGLVSKYEVSHENILGRDVKSVAEKDLVSPVVENVQTVPLSRSQVSLESSKPKFDREKAFTGSIVEHADNLQIKSRERTTAISQSSASQVSKPVSRFKMQRK